MFSFPVIELVDRYTIAQVKYDRTQGANQAELDFYQTQIDLLDIQSPRLARLRTNTCIGFSIFMLWSLFL